MDQKKGYDDYQASPMRDTRALRLKSQHNSKFSLYPTRTRPSNSASISPTSSLAPQVPSLPNSTQSSSIATPSEPEQQRPVSGRRSASNASYRTSTNIAAQVQSPRHIPSEASRLRVLNTSSSPHLLDNRRTHEVLQSENFSRPRKVSIKGSEEKLQHHVLTSSTFPLQPQTSIAVRGAVPSPARNRGLSTSSSRSASALRSKPIRPSTAVSDYAPDDSNHSWQRNFSNISNYRGTGNLDGNVNHSHHREPTVRHNVVDVDEVRASFRSALTTNSSAFGTSGTERSSVVTKSSATSIFGRDDSMSVDDAIGMYEGGFADSCAEDDYASRPESSNSHQSWQMRRQKDRNETVLASTLSGMIISDSITVSQEPEDMRNLDGTSSYPTTDFTRQTIQLPECVPSLDILNTSLNYPVQEPPSSSFDDTRDRYGFRKKSQHISLDQYESWNGPYTEFLSRRRKKWVALLKDSNLSTEKLISFPPKSTKLKRFIRKGIPPDWRGSAWFWYAGGPAILAKHPGLYSELVQKCENGAMSATDEELIERDLHRTFPDNIRFKPDPVVSNDTRHNGSNSNQAIAEPETPLLQSLRRVLQAFSIYNPRIGYCQSLNFLTGLLLLFTDEEKSFWLLNIITRVYLPGTHEVNLEGANVDLGVLMTSIKESMPTVWAKIGGGARWLSWRRQSVNASSSYYAVLHCLVHVLFYWKFTY